MKSIVLSICLLYSSILAYAQTDSLSIATADLAYKNQKYAQSLELYTQLLKSDTSNTIYSERAGISAYKLGDLKATKDIFTNLQKREPDNNLALKQLASIYEIEGNTPKAIKYYSRLIKSEYTNAIYFRKLGQQYMKAKLFEEAKSYFEKAYGLNPKDNFAISGLAEIYLKSKDYLNTDSLLNVSLAYDESNLAHRLLIAKSKYSQKDYLQTTEHLEKAKRLIDLNNYYHKMLGYSYLKIDSIDKAINYLERSLVNEGNPEHAHYYLASAYETKGETETSIFHYEKAIEAGISKDVDLYHRNLARIYDQDKDLKNAIPHYEEAYKYSIRPVLLFYLARAYDVYYADKNVAIRYYSKYEKSGDPNPEYINYAKERKKYLIEQRHFEKAKSN